MAAGGTGEIRGTPPVSPRAEHSRGRPRKRRPSPEREDPGQQDEKSGTAPDDESDGRPDGPHIDIRV